MPRSLGTKGLCGFASAADARVALLLTDGTLAAASTPRYRIMRTHMYLGFKVNILTVLGLVGGAPGGETPRFADSSASKRLAEVRH